MGQPKTGDEAMTARSGLGEMPRTAAESSSTRITVPEADARDALGHLERELRRVACNLHDGPVQSLAAAETMLDRAGRGDRADTIRAEIAAAQGLLTHALEEMRDVMRDLRPAALDAKGLDGKLATYLEDYEADTTIRSSLKVEGDLPALSPPAEEALFRIAQEALTNVRRHAQATRIEVTLLPLRGGVVCDVSDDGVGFDAESMLSQTSNSHWGLKGMAERAALVGGNVNLGTAPGKGTVVRAWVPAKVPWI